jgi:hypothetical protein
MAVLPKPSATVDLEQIIDLTGRLSWYMSSPSTIIAGSTVLLTIKGNAPPFTWAITGAAANDEAVSLRYAETKALWNILNTDITLANNPIVEVTDIRGNKITQNIIVS